MRISNFKIVLVIAALALISCKRNKGCTDTTALNYDPDAKVDCQCCEYDNSPKNFNGSLKIKLNMLNNLTSINPFDTAKDYLQRKYIVEDMVMYFSNLTLINEFNQDVPLKDVAHFNFYNTSNTELVLDSVLQGTYNGIKFGLGVDSAMNTKSPIDYPFSHELGQSNSAYHWGPKGYVFVRFGGKADLDFNNTMEQLYVYHVGTDSLYRQVEFNTPIVIVKDQETVYDLNINLNKIWVSGMDTIDIATEYTTHTNPGDPLAKKFTDHFKDALSD